MRGLLNTNPEYEIQGNDPLEFQYLYHTFRTEPHLYFTVKAGVNQTIPKVQNSYTIDHNQADDRENAYKSEISQSYGLDMDIPLNQERRLKGLQKQRRRDTFTLGRYAAMVGIGFNRHTYSYKHLMQTDPSLDLDYTTVLFQETQNWVTLPFAIKYTLPSYRYKQSAWEFRRLVPYVYWGGSGHYLIQSNFSNLNRIADNRQLNNPPIVELTVFDTNGNNQATSDLPRRRYNFSAMVGGGIKWWVKRDYITLDIRYSQMLFNFVDANNRYQNQTLLHLFGYVDSDALLQNTYLMIGYQHPIYNPKQIKLNK